MQWVGLATEDSTWEKWEDACSSHHLEDKVIFPGEDIVSTSSGEGVTREERTSNNKSATQEERPRRTITRPRYLESYV